MRDFDRATQSERRWSFPVTAFHVISMVSRQDLQPLLPLTNSLIYPPTAEAAAAAHPQRIGQNKSKQASNISYCEMAYHLGKPLTSARCLPVCSRSRRDSRSRILASNLAEACLSTMEDCMYSMLDCRPVNYTTHKLYSQNT